MKNLSKTQASEADMLVDALRKRSAEVEQAVAAINDAVTSANDAIAAYNEALANMESFREETVNAMDEYMGERSEKWLEGEAGEAYSSWKDEWEALSLDQVDPIDEIDIPDMSHADDVEALPTEPSQ